MPLPAGTRLGPYEILASIGAGGMGEVYKARDTRLNRLVAVKVSKEEFSERFEREARAVAALSHPNICTLHDVGPNYLVMELLDGVLLKGPLPVEKAVEYAGQILEALDAAHRKGITHRDLKPANILVTRLGIKLLDFGLAKQTTVLKENEATLTQALTSPGQILGTLQYMAPEQLQGKEADARSDLFSFGCVLYEMLSGKRAFAAESPASVIAAILEREPAPLVPEGTPTSPLERIVKRSLAKDPEQRFQTARDLKSALNWALEQPDAPAASKPGRWWFAMAALVAGAVGGWGVSHFLQTPMEARPYRLQINPPDGSRFTFENRVGGLALSPDGRTAAFVTSGGSGKSGLWVRPLDGVAARLIAGTEGASYPFWSPDDKSVAFFSGGKLRRVDLAGGAPSTICDVTGWRGGAWNSDGRILYGTSSGLSQISASGGTSATLTTLDPSRGEGYHRWPQVLPGGRFIYLIQSGKPENTGIYAASFAKPGERRRLLATDTNALYAPGVDGKSYLLWLRGGTLVAQQLDTGTLKLEGEPHSVVDPVSRLGAMGRMNVAVSANGLLLYGETTILSQFTWLDRTGKSLGTVGEPGEYSTFRLSPDGRRIVATVDGPGPTDLWLLEVERGVASRFTSDNSAFGVYPIWSPDGRTILYSSGLPGNLFRKESGGAGKEHRLSRSPNVQLATDWSRDGRYVLYYTFGDRTQRDLWVFHVSPDGKPEPDATFRPYIETPFNEWAGRFSPEAPPRWVTYQSDETGRSEVYIQAFPEPHGATRISRDGGHDPQWGAGARELFYVSPDSKLMVVSLKVGEGTVAPSAARELFPLPVVEPGPTGSYDATPDGQRFLVRASSGRAVQPLTVIVNWPALLKKQALAQ